MNWTDFPLRLFASHMASIYGISQKRFYALEQQGAYVFAEIKPRIGRKSWSRDRVQQHYDGTLAGLTAPKKLRIAS